MTFADALREARRAPDSSNLQRLANIALEAEEEAEALPLVETGAAAMDDPRLWQWTALLYRACDDRQAALKAFERAAHLAPADAGIAHGHARVALEAGLPSSSLFKRAIKFETSPGPVLIGLGAARFAEGQGDRALSELERTLVAHPLWIDGHRQFSQLATLLGKAARATVTFDRAIAKRADPRLVQARAQFLVAAERFDVLPSASEGLPTAEKNLFTAIALTERGDVGPADALFAAMPDQPANRVWRVRHLLRTGRPDEAVPLIDRWVESPDSNSAWPYAAIVWRLVGDPRWAWLEGDPRLVAHFDLSAELPDLAPLLRRLHARSGSFADQSVRGGSQTDGPLLARIDPEITALRELLTRTVRQYQAGLPPPDPDHPLLSQRRNRPIRFSGSWSVRLGAAGHHSNHVHPQGWISSALYIALPDEMARPDDPKAGWLTLGEPQASLGITMPPSRLIEPRPGRLVLFPSTMWHGTRPFAQGERLTVAFDVARPAP